MPADDARLWNVEASSMEKWEMQRISTQSSGVLILMVVSNNMLIIRKNYVNYVDVGGGTDANCKIKSGSPLPTRSALYLPGFLSDRSAVLADGCTLIGGGFCEFWI